MVEQIEIIKGKISHWLSLSYNNRWGDTSGNGYGYGDYGYDNLYGDGYSHYQLDSTKRLIGS